MRGILFSDRNGDGIRQKDEPGIGGATVVLDVSTFTTTAANGSYEMLAPVDMGRVWVSVPDGYRPGPVWRMFDGGVVDLPVTPLTDDEAASPLTFVVASDSHMANASTCPTNPATRWDGGDLADAIDQAVSLPDRPRFFALDGDITGGSDAAQFARVHAALETIDVPWIPVPGNHDWGDGGRNFRAAYGLDNYSFDIGNVHFVVWNTNGVDTDPTAELAFLESELAHVPSSKVIVAFSHHAVLDETLTRLEELGVDYMFTGHWHANRVIHHPRIVEYSTQTFVMGGIDETAPGYRIVTFDEGVPSVRHRERMVESQLDLVAPHAGTCVPPTDVPMIVSASLDASTPEVTVRVDCGPAQPLAAAASTNGWSFTGQLAALPVGTHSLTIEAMSAGGRRVEKQIAIEVCPAPSSALSLGDWPQLGGNAAHTNARSTAIVPPLVARWTANVGGTISLGTPVVADGTVVLVVTDNGGGDRGGLVALDLATGVEKWRSPTPEAAVGAAAIAEGIVVVNTKQGMVYAVSLATGARLWTYDAAEGLDTHSSSLWAPPTVADGFVYIAVQGNFAALDLVTGVPSWERDPQDPSYHWLGSLAAVAVGDGSAVAAFNRTRGLASWSATTGASLWDARDSRMTAINSSPVIDNGTVYFINSSGQVYAGTLAADAAHVFRQTWRTDLFPTPVPYQPNDAAGNPVTQDACFGGANEWHYAVMATPAIANGKLFVASQWNDLFALDAATGAILWRAQAPAGSISFAHYQSAMPGWPASPVVVGDLVWIGGLDGTLFAFAVDDGHVVWSTPLGAPISSAVAPAGDALVVASYDGSVRLLAPGTPSSPAAITACPAAPPAPAPSDGGCGVTRPGTLALLLGVGLFARRRRARIRSGPWQQSRSDPR